MWGSKNKTRYPAQLLVIHKTSEHEWVVTLETMERNNRHLRRENNKAIIGFTFCTNRDEIGNKTQCIFTYEAKETKSGHSRSFSPAIAAISRPTLAQSRRFLAHFARRLRAQIFWLYVWVPFCLLQCEIASVLFYLTSASLSCWCTVVPPAV